MSDPDALADERDFLLASLDDLEAERAAGDVSDDDYRTLRDDYTARAAAVLRAMGGDVGGDANGDPDGGPDGDPHPGRPGPGTGPAPRWRRIGLPVLAVVVVAVLAGVMVAQASGRRGDGGLTGLDVEAAGNRIDDCQARELEGDVEEALSCYADVLESLPANVQARTFRGWLLVREGRLEEGIADLDAAIQVAPGATAPYVFRASARLRAGDPAGSVADLATFYGNDPGEEETTLADAFVPAVVEAALDTCIDGDVTGSLQPVAVLACYRDVLAVDEGNATAAAYLGWLLARSGADDEAASTLLDGAVAADPDLGAARVFRAALRAHLGDVAGALDDLDAFDSLDAPADQVAAAQQVRSVIEAGGDPLVRRASR